MNWRYLIFDFVDPQIPLTARQRRETAKRVQSMYMYQPGIFRVIALLFGMFLLLVASIILLIRVDPRFGLLGVPGMLPIMWIMQMHFAPRLCRSLVASELRRIGYEVCAGCGYWLRNLPDDVERCPECGAEREPMPEVKR